MEDREIEIELAKTPNKSWEKFLRKAYTYDIILPQNWKVSEVLGYFMKRFKDAFGKEYKLKFNTTAPSKSYEVFRINTCSSRLSSDPIILKRYIDWIFDQRVAKDNKSFRSIAFLVADDNINWYRENVLFAGQMGNIDRSTKLPDNIQSIVDPLGCNTYGDLAFLIKANIASEQMTKATEQLKEIKFDFSMLDKIV